MIFQAIPKRSLASIHLTTDPSFQTHFIHRENLTYYDTMLLLHKVRQHQKINYIFIRGRQ